MDGETREKLLEELRKDYIVTIKPLADSRFSVKDIIDKYWENFRHLVTSSDPNCRWVDYRGKESFGMAVRRIMCIKYGVWNIQEIPYEKRRQFRADMEAFIQELK